MTEMTSASLLWRLHDPQDRSAWEEFAGRYYQVIGRWLRAQGVNAQDADDVAQEVMMFVCQDIAKFEHNGRVGAFRNWLRQVTANRLREFWRKKGRHLRPGHDLGRFADELAVGRGELSQVWNREHDRFVLEHLLDTVRDRFQPSSLTAFRRIVLEERPAKEVAEELGMTLGAVRVAQSRVLRSLRDVGAGMID